MVSTYSFIVYMSWVTCKIGNILRCQTTRALLGGEICDFLVLPAVVTEDDDLLRNTEGTDPSV